MKLFLLVDAALSAPHRRPVALQGFKGAAFIIGTTPQSHAADAAIKAMAAQVIHSKK